MDELELETEFEYVEPEELYDAWLSSGTHTAMTGGVAKIKGGVGGAFTAWDGYISGTTLELSPGRRIVQSWRTTDFDEADADSRLELLFRSNGSGGTQFTIRHTNLPAGQGETYETGWEQSYIEPMAAYFDPE